MKSRAEGVTVEQQPEVEIVSAFADLRCGMLLAEPHDQQPDPRLESLAAAMPELFASDRAPWDGSSAFQHIVLVSREHVHVAMRCSDDPSVALIAIAPRGRSVGSIMAEARGRLAQRLGTV